MWLTLLLLIIYLGIIVGGFRLRSETDQVSEFMPKDQTSILKGMCCILVILVHIPVAYANRLQDMAGSFAYIAVSLYFMLSAYGLRFSFENKRKYADMFIRNRVIPLLIPFILIVTLKRFLGFAPFIGGLKFIYVLMMFYALTYITYRLNITGGGYLVCVGVLLYSLVGYLINIGFGWYVESLGFAYGFLLGNKTIKDKITTILQRNWIAILFITLASSGVLGILYLKCKQIYFGGEYLVRVALGIALISLVITLMYKIKLGNRMNMLLGKISYEIYLIHGFVISVLSLAGDYFKSGVFVMLTVALSVLIAIPWNRFNQKITDRIKK